MINQYKDSDIKIYGNTGVLEYYSLNGVDEWAFLGYSALTFVFFFLVAYIVSVHSLACPSSSGICSCATYPSKTQQRPVRRSSCLHRRCCLMTSCKLRVSRASSRGA